MNTQHLQSPAFYRIGAISKLSGIPVPTLRVWQTRYNAFSPATTQGQHRLYNDDDLRKAALLKTLTRQGHAISLIAGLTNAQLQQLLQTSADMARAPLQSQEAASPSQGAWGVVGKSLAERLQSTDFQASRQGHALHMRRVWADLNEALNGPLAGPSDERLDVLLVSVNSLNDQAAQQILTLSQHHNARLTVVLYGYGQTHALAQLSRAACQVHRNTLDDSALADIVQSARPAWVAPTRSWRDTGQAIPPRQFSDAVLQRVANIPSQVLCECPKHVAELIGQLGRFEEYSRDCLNQSPKDTELHTHLNAMAASARALFEEALQMVAAHEGISLREQA
ncbi:MerR family transcriptional regulator [uncultured Limnohabitans sp.]|uniref:MerR family transcriptional regulator n=1 Tax=uncultured Limnohabitans sp. TaxID=768543 RepID=UPI00261EC7F3|nr:MerR family transcriptional regulator [uncultured Limnohabitans sp.]